MKKITLVLALFLIGIGFAQNESSGSIATTISTPSPLSGETFRFGPGLVTQLDAGTAFDFNASQWFSIGRLNTGSQNVYGLRFQLKNRALTMGYQDTNDINPRIQWIGDSFASSTDLEFRVANSFTSTTSRLVATMTNDGKTFFGIPLTAADAVVGVDYSSFNSTRTGFTSQNTTGSSGFVTGIKSTNSASCYVKTGVQVESSGGAYSDSGITVRLSDAFQSSGVRASVTGSSNGSTYGVQGFINSSVSNPTGFGAAIYGSSPTTANRYAGYFNGNVVVTGSFSASDKKLKENIESEENLLEKLAQLDAVKYKFKQIDELNLPTELQHGFIAQNIEEVFPELVTTVIKPIFGKENEEVGTFEYKAVNYVGLISVLTSGVNEMNAKMTALEGELEDLKRAVANSKNSIGSQEDKEIGFSMDQNRPNPFTSQTTINYTIPDNKRAVISVFDMSGKFVRDYNLSSQKGQVVISSNEIGKGMFIYSLVSDGEIMVTKKMIVK
ncbi:tail fiber domain-containing protein [Kordia sp.]|uniref:tail fiber domain-containing protein n=1 Tax=Kordia sp. TaxID=1965332 RepID=UPI0025BAAF13|nr:tail fiber domain-containing protein [Kordia sp.]MCH2192872.1 tail fiber domain-containing protein [Kordia sp.]